MSKEKLFKRINDTVFVVGYDPLLDEIDYKTLVINGKQCVPGVIVPQDRNVDPFIFANVCIEMCGNKRTCVLVPGTLFDRFGNRKGRGDGWFDRFLSRIPSTWLRIGVCKRSQMSDVRLQTQVWDEPVDGVFVYEPTTETWEIVETPEEKNK